MYSMYQFPVKCCRSRVGRGHVPPLYLQHQGHSRTIVGVEVMKKSDTDSGGVRLLVFDPSNNKMANFLTGTHTLLVQDTEVLDYPFSMNKFLNISVLN